MKNLFFFLVPILGISLAKAQSSVAPGFDQNNYPQFSINLAVIDENLNNADVFFEEGERFERLGDYDGAVSMYNKAASEYQHQKKYSKYGTALIKLSDAHLILSNYKTAEKIILNQALKNYTKIGSKAGQMNAYKQLGKIYLAANQLTQSLWFFSQQGILAFQIQDKKSQIESILGLAAVKIKKRDYQLAIKDLNRAELMAKNANLGHFNQLIKNNRATIAEKTMGKKA